MTPGFVSRSANRRDALPGPPEIRLVDRAAEKRLVEAGEFCDIRTVQNHTLKPADHQIDLPARPGPWNSIESGVRFGQREQVL